MSPALGKIIPVINSLKNSNARTATSVGHKTCNVLTHLWWEAYLQKYKIMGGISQEKYFQGVSMSVEPEPTTNLNVRGEERDTCRRRGKMML